MKETYAWVNWFTELSKKIASNDEKYLVERAKEIQWKDDGTKPPLLKYGDDSVDPFSFLYTVASKNRFPSQRERVFVTISDLFELNSKLPDFRNEDYFLFPTPNPQRGILFHDNGQGESESIWNVLRDAVKGIEHVTSIDFNKILNIRSIKVGKLSQVLFLINPNDFLPCDRHVKLPGLAESSEVLDFEKYKEYLIKALAKFPGCKPYEINSILFLINHEENPIKINSHRCFQVSSNAWGEDGPDFWDVGENNFRENNWIFTGGMGEVRKYPLTDPKIGDIILARTGKIKARGVGVVHQNDYVSGEEIDLDNDKIHVYWICKKDVTDVDASFTRMALTNARASTVSAFERCYPETFMLLIHWSTKKPKIQSMNSRNLVLYGPPGTGKTYSTTRKCVEICDGNCNGKDEDYLRGRFQELRDDDERIEFVTFHQSYGYEEFVEGLRPETLSGELAETGSDSRLENSSAHHTASTTGGFRLKSEAGVLKRIADRAREDGERSYVLIIDEINRANISKVLGELVTLLEEDKREGADNEVSITLPYSKEAFTLPANLYILGTMNTADRSIALIDTALRRRFVFVEMPPEPERLEVVDGVNLPKVLETINERLEYLVDRDHLVGHAWFMGCENLDQIGNVMRNKIIPLLAEYFYDDWNKVRAVLGGGDHFVTRKKLNPPPGLEEDGGEDRYRWTVNELPYSKEAYEDLIKPPSNLESSE